MYFISSHMYGHITVIYMYTLYQVHYTLCLVSYYKDVSCNWLVEVRATEDEQFHLLWAYLSLKVSIVSSNIVIERNIFTFSHTPPPHSATSHCGIWNILCLIKYFLSGWQCRQQLEITRGTSLQSYRPQWSELKILISFYQGWDN